MPSDTEVAQCENKVLSLPLKAYNGDNKALLYFKLGNIVVQLVSGGSEVLWLMLIP